MTDFVERLPLRLAALAGLLVGIVSLIAQVDPWECVLRVGAAFAIFAGLGLLLRALLRHRPAPHTDAAPPDTPDQPGAHVDQTTPEMTVDDL